MVNDTDKVLKKQTQELFSLNFQSVGFSFLLFFFIPHKNRYSMVTGNLTFPPSR